MKDPVARADPRVIMRQTGGAAPGAGQHRRRQSRQRRATDGAGEDDLDGRAAADTRTAPGADERACTDRGLLMTGLVFRGATLIDGTGSDERLADVFVAMGVITAIEEPGRMRGAAGRTIDADGLVLAPGFIDAHTHGDAAPFLPEIDDSKISQGVTTEVVGNCGFSLAPCPPSRRADIAELCGRLFPRLPFDWSSTADLHAQLDAAGSVTNTVALAGHSTLRAAAMGLDDRRAEPAEVDSMRADLRAALAAGARGLSSGLIYPPGMYSDADELVELASLLGEEDVYTTHIRNEGRQLHESVREAITVARRAGCRLQVSHLKAAGQASWGGVPAALRLMDVARRSGMTVHHDVYPYDANSTMLASCLPPWFHDGGYAATMARLHDPLALARAERELERSDGTWQNWVAESGWTNVLVASTAAHRHEGLTLDRIAKSSGRSPFEALVEILVANDLQATMSVFAMSADDIEAALTHPFAIVGSDGLPPGTGGKPHPRSYGTFTRVLGHYVRATGCLSWPEAVAKMTSRTAAAFALHDRGVIRVGAAADVILFDPESIADTATFLDPTSRSVGIELVAVNGEVSYEQGQTAGVRAGRRL